MKSTLSGNGLAHAMLDTKPYVRYHPVIGYEYIPGTELCLPAPAGGEYIIRINSAGIRSDRDYSLKKPAGVFRIVAFGDSFAAGQYINNEHRFSELLERRIPGLEVINFGLEGTGTDQQLLLFEQVCKYECDLVLLLPFLQNVRRNLAEYRVARDAQTGQEVFSPKPRFELGSGGLVLCNVPVPCERLPLESAGNARSRTDSDRVSKFNHKIRLSRMAERLRLKPLIYGIVPREPFLEYKSSKTPGWKLMAAIIYRFKQLAGARPVVIAPIFYASYVRYKMARNYWDRFNSLADGKSTYAIDLLPYFRRLGAEATRCFLEPYDCHFSIHGHLVLANALETEFRRLKLLP